MHIKGRHRNLSREMPRLKPIVGCMLNKVRTRGRSINFEVLVKLESIFKFKFKGSLSNGCIFVDRRLDLSHTYIAIYNNRTLIIKCVFIRYPTFKFKKDSPICRLGYLCLFVKKKACLYMTSSYKIDIKYTVINNDQRFIDFHWTPALHFRTIGSR